MKTVADCTRTKVLFASVSAVAAGTLLALVASAGEGAVPVSAPKVPANTWVKAAVDVKAALSTAKVKDARWKFTDGYSDSVYRSKTGSVLIRTGVRSKAAKIWPGFYTNTTVEWDPKTDKASVLEIAQWSGGSYGGANPLPGYKEHPTPNPRHTYDGICYVPEEDAMYMLFGAYFRSARKNASEEGKKLIGAESKNTWRFSFEKKRWTRIDGSPKKLGLKIRSIYETHLTHWPAKKKLIFLDNGGRNGAEFDLATQKWSKALPTNKPSMRLYHARSTWDSKRSLWVFRRGADLCTYDPAKRKFEKLPECWDLGISHEQRMKCGDRPAEKRIIWKGICYIPKHDAYLVTGPTGDDTMVYHVAEKKWRSVKAGNIKLPNGYCHYSPGLDAVTLNIHLQCFKFRYEPDKAGPAAEKAVGGK